MFSFVLGKLLGVKLGSWNRDVYNLQKKKINNFLRQFLHFCLPPVMWEFQLFHILTNIWYSLFILAIIICFKVYVEFLSCVYCLCYCLKYKGQYATIIIGFHFKSLLHCCCRNIHFGELTFVKYSKYFNIHYYMGKKCSKAYTFRVVVSCLW